MEKVAITYTIYKNIMVKIVIYLQDQNCFLKCINYLTQKNYKNEYYQFINSESSTKKCNDFS